MKLSDYFVQSSIFKFLFLLLFKYNHKRKTNANKPEGTRKENRDLMKINPKKIEK